MMMISAGAGSRWRTILVEHYGSLYLWIRKRQNNALEIERMYMFCMYVGKQWNEVRIVRNNSFVFLILFSLVSSMGRGWWWWIFTFHRHTLLVLIVWILVVFIKNEIATDMKYWFSEDLQSAMMSIKRTKMPIRVWRNSGSNCRLLQICSLVKYLSLLGFSSVQHSWR